MKQTLLLFLVALVSFGALAQTKGTTSAVVAFDASTSLDNLPKAENKTVIGEIDTKTGNVDFEAAVKNFAFSNPMMQNHFNSDKWMKSSQYPVFTFSGKITDLSKVSFTKNGTYTVPVTGDLTIKDITKQISITAQLVVKGDKIEAVTEFSIKLADYNISDVSINAGKVSKEPKISVSATFK